MSPAAELLQHITAARWFGGNRDTARLVRLHPLPWLRRPGHWPAVRLEIAEIGYAGSAEHEFYQLLLSYRPAGSQRSAELIRWSDPEHGELIATSGDEDPAARDALLVAALERAGDESADDAPEHPLRWRGGGGRAARLLAELHPGMPSQLFGGEQSNTSILYAHLALLKLFRRLEIGSNPDIEIHRLLSSDVDDPDVATLLGSATGAWADPETGTTLRADLAMLVEQLADSRDGWEYALARIRAGESFAAEAESLGGALARIHHRLRDAFGTGSVEGDRVAEAMIGRLGQATTAVPALAPYQAGLSRAFTAVAGRQLAVQRIHGDFHLGQCLHSARGWKIIDFEGEPMKPLADRVRPDSTVRDLAGALRSFDYAAAHADHSATVAARWADQSRNQFLRGYALEQERLGAGDPGTDPELLTAYLADKAVYEVVYESRHRPDWASIPLTAVRQLARAPDLPTR